MLTESKACTPGEHCRQGQQGLGGSTAQQKAWLESGGERGRQSVRAKSGLQPIAWVLEGLEEWTTIQVF